MHVWNTESGVEEGSFENTEVRKLKGLRKRWADKVQGHAQGSSVEKDSEGERLSMAGSGTTELAEGLASVSKVPRFLEPSRKVLVADETSDDFLGTDVKDLDKPTSSGHKHERDALLNTNLSVFKYPWEKGRLASIFGPPPTIKVPVPKLSPGGRNFVQVGLAISAGGQVASTTLLKPKEQTVSAFVQVVRKVEDIEVEDDRARRRQHALDGFWSLLSMSIVSSAVGLKVTVESTMDTVRDCAMKILDATFTVKSPGTLLRRLYSLQSYQQWCSY